MLFASLTLTSFHFVTILVNIYLISQGLHSCHLHVTVIVHVIRIIWTLAKA